LTTEEQSEIIISEDHMPRPRTMTEVLRRALAESGIPLIQLERETGIQRMSLSRFLAGRQTLHLDVADELAKFLDLHLVVGRRRRPRKKG
jgi:hypothetical protein